MTAHIARWPRVVFGPRWLPATVVVALGLLFGLLLVPFDNLSAIAFVAYWLFVAFTIRILRGVPAEPGAWLGRRSVRRGLVTLIALVCALFAVSPGQLSGWAVLLTLFLVFCDLLLGRATRRIAAAPDEAVDERQEALRNRAHRLAYAILAILAGGTVVVTEVASVPSRAWLAGVMQSGAILAFLQLLLFLPAMVIAWLEPDRVADEAAPASPGRREWTAIGMVAIALVTPIVLALGLVLGPVRTSSFQSPEAGADPATQCRYFDATRRVGVGFGAAIRLSAVGCWNGTRAFEEWGMNASDCLQSSGVMAWVRTARCSRMTDADGTLRFTYVAHVESIVLPFLSRDVPVSLALTKDGTVVRFP